MGKLSFSSSGKASQSEYFLISFKYTELLVWDLHNFDSRNERVTREP